MRWSYPQQGQHFHNFNFRQSNLVLLFEEIKGTSSLSNCFLPLTDSLRSLPATLAGFGSKTGRSGRSESVIHYVPLTIMGHKECNEKHYDELETSDSEYVQALRTKVALILNLEKKISKELLCIIRQQLMTSVLVLEILVAR